MWSSNRDATTSQSVHDARCTGRVSDVVQIVKEGKITFSDQRWTSTLLVYHVDFCFYEMLIFTPDASSVWCRFYISDASLKQELDQTELERRLEEAKNFYRRRHRHINLEQINRTVNFEMVTELLESRAQDFLNYDLHQRIEQQVSKSERGATDIFGDFAIYQDFNKLVCTLLSPKPELLLPINIDPAQKKSHYEQFQRLERLRLRLQNVLAWFMTSSFSEPNNSTTPQSPSSATTAQPAINKPTPVSVGRGHGVNGFIQTLRMSFGSTSWSSPSKPSVSASSPSHSMSIRPTLRISTFFDGLSRQVQRFASPKASSRPTRRSASLSLSPTAALSPHNTALKLQNPAVRLRWIKAYRRVIMQFRVQKNRELWERWEAKQQRLNQSLHQHEDDAELNQSLSPQRKEKGKLKTTFFAVGQRVKTSLAFSMSVKKSQAKKLNTKSGSAKVSPAPLSSTTSSPAVPLSVSSSYSLAAQSSLPSTAKPAEPYRKKFVSKFPLLHLREEQ